MLDLWNPTYPCIHMWLDIKKLIELSHKANGKSTLSSYLLAAPVH